VTIRVGYGSKLEVVAISTLSLDLFLGLISASFLHDVIINLSEILVVEGWKSC
jgi:hypothetical protein